MDGPSSFACSSNVRSSDEVTRASRFHFEKDRRHFVRYRSALRILRAGTLASYPPKSASNMSLAEARSAMQPNPQQVRFNVSHRK